jgi:hypothetical protein
MPERFVAKSGPRNRVGRIFIDYLRNGFGATTVAAWSAARAPGAGHLGAGRLGRAAEAHVRRAFPHRRRAGAARHRQPALERLCEVRALAAPGDAADRFRAVREAGQSCASRSRR